MKAKELNLSIEDNLNSVNPRIGGNSFIPSNIEWPKNKDGNNLTLIASIPCEFFKEYVNLDFHDGSFISVFSTYDENDYFLDLITYHGDDEEMENINSGFTKVLIHEKGSPRNESNCIIPSKIIMPKDDINDDIEYTGSKIGGNAGILQKENLKLVDNYVFAFQLYGADFPEGFEGIFELSDAVGYLYLNSDDGKFFVQAT
jgi:hypothetical protein